MFIIYSCILISKYLQNIIYKKYISPIKIYNKIQKYIDYTKLYHKILYKTIKKGYSKLQFNDNTKQSKPIISKNFYSFIIFL